MKNSFSARIVVLCTVCLLAGCPTWRQVTVRISEQELQERLEEQFPFTRTYRFVGTLTCRKPRITLRRNDNRVALGLDIILADAGRHGGVLQGSIVMIASLRYSAEEKSLYLTEPRLQQLTIDGMPEQNVQLLGALFMPAVEKLLERRPVYRFKDEHGRKKLAAMLVRDIRVRNGYLEIVYGV